MYIILIRYGHSHGWRCYTVFHMFSTNRDMIMSQLSRLLWLSVTLLGQAVANRAAFAIGDDQRARNQVA